MLSTRLIAGALVLSGSALAGTAAADCPLQGALGVFDSDYAEVCVMEHYSNAYPPYYQFNSDSPLRTNVYGANSDGTYFSQYTEVYRYDGQSCWGSCVQYAGFGFYNYAVLCADAGCFGGGMNGGQYHGTTALGEYFGSYANAEAYAAGQDAYLYYEQFTANGACNEYAILDGPLGYTEVVPYQPCAVVIPLLPDLPPL